MIKSKINTDLDDAEHITLDELITLYKATIEKLQECSRYNSFGDLNKNILNSKKENKQLLLQEKIMVAVLNRQINQMSDVKKILKFWKLCVLSIKGGYDYDDSDHLVLKSLDYMETAKI